MGSRRFGDLHKSIETAQSSIKDTQKKLAEACQRLHSLSEAKILADATRAAEFTISSVVSDLSDTIAEAKSTRTRHIKALTRYNETRDAAMVLLGTIAENEGKTVAAVLEERGIEYE